MNILVVNRGSSSLKCSLYSFDRLPDKYEPPQWEAKEEVALSNTDENQIEKSLKPLWEKISPEEIHAVGHRVVHGGRIYRKSVLINSAVEQEIKKLSELAPLHNLANLRGIDESKRLFPEILQVAVFDTAFHRTLPQVSAIYPGPYSWFEKEIERYGFHGISFQYCTRRTHELSVQHDKMIICHLGSGASLCAVKEGKSIDTTMGFTPLEGLMMDTRSGTIDPGILLYLLQTKKMTVEQLYEELYYHSGLLGISGISEDMRVILKKAFEGHERSLLALDLYIYRVCSCIGSLIVSLGGLDTLVFTGGIGENAPLIREKICSHLAFLGVHLDSEKNNNGGARDRNLSSLDTNVQILLIHTQEAYEIARECIKFM